MNFIPNKNSTILPNKGSIVEQNLKYNGYKHTLGCIYTIVVFNVVKTELTKKTINEKSLLLE